MSSRTARATQRNPVSKKQKQKQKNQPTKQKNPTVTGMPKVYKKSVLVNYWTKWSRENTDGSTCHFF
jgi:chitinase